MSTTEAPSRPVPEAGAATRRPLANALPALVGVTVCLLPFLRPAGPGNTALADAGIAGCLLVGLLWLVRTRLPLRLPYAVGVTGLLLGGALAATLAAAPLGTALVLAQDVFLLLWAAVLALGAYDPAIVVSATVAWCRIAAVYATLGVMAYLVGFAPLSGVTASEGVRAAYTFGDPNLAGNYLVMSLLIMGACKRPRAKSTRWAAYLIVLVAIGFTGSNGAMLTLAVAGLMCFTLSQWQRYGSFSGVVALVATALAVAVLVVGVMPRVDLTSVRQAAAGSIPLLRDSVGRSGSSTSERATILDEGYHLFLDGTATGVGPARTKATLARAQAGYVKEAHNDYLATLLERGVVGAVGLIMLGFAIATRCLRLLRYRLPPPYSTAVPRAWVLVVVAPVMATAAGFYEVLHFRHLWTWLGIVAALALVTERPDRSGRRARLPGARRGASR